MSGGDLRVSEGCLRGVWRVFGGCLEVVKGMSGGVSGGSLGGVWSVSGGCLVVV